MFGMKNILRMVCVGLIGVMATAHGQIAPPAEKVIHYFTKDGALIEGKAGSEYYRKLLMVVNGCHLVQDFYSENDAKQIDAVCFTDEKDLNSWNPQSIQGTVTFWTPTGEQTQVQVYDKGLRHGKQMSWHLNGKKALEGDFVNGKEHGVWINYDEAGQEIERFNFIDGRLLVAYFTKDGILTSAKEEGMYYRLVLDATDAQRIIIQDFYVANNAKQTDPLTITDKHDLFAWTINSMEGTAVFYTQEGLKAGEEHYVNGKLNGKIRTWYPSGQLKVEANFLNGEREGQWRTWYNNGQLRSEAYFVAGQWADSSRAWHKNGQRKAEGQYRNNQMHGSWITWDEAGNKIMTEHYIQGNKISTEDNANNTEVAAQLTPSTQAETTREATRTTQGNADGEWIFWHDNGQIRSQGNFVNGKWSGKWQNWYQNGAKKSEGNYVDGLLEDRWTYWYDNGQKKSEGNYDKGNRSGRWVFWHDNGHKKSEGNYRADQKSGHWIFWHKNGEKKSEGNYN